MYLVCGMCASQMGQGITSPLRNVWVARMGVERLDDCRKGPGCSRRILHHRNHTYTRTAAPHRRERDITELNMRTRSQTHAYTPISTDKDTKKQT